MRLAMLLSLLLTGCEWTSRGAEQDYQIDGYVKATPGACEVHISRGEILNRKERGGESHSVGD